MENVWVAGSILADHHSVDEKSREGIEITTGYMAAKQAIGEITHNANYNNQIMTKVPMTKILNILSSHQHEVIGHLDIAEIGAYL